jgi:hypothetical protein
MRASQYTDVNTFTCYEQAMHILKSTAEGIGKGLLFDSQHSLGVKLLYAESSLAENCL